MSIELSSTASRSFALTVTESHDSIQSIKYYRVIDHAIIVKLAKVLDLCNPSLVEFEVVLLQTEHDVFQDIVDNSRDEILMVTRQCANHDGK